MLLPLVLVFIIYSKNCWLNFGAVNKSCGMCLEYLAMGLLVLAVSLLFPSKLRAIFLLLVLTDVVSSVFMLGNQMYFRRFGDYVSVNLFGMANHLPGVWRDVASLFRWHDIAFFINIPFTVWLCRTFPSYSATPLPLPGFLKAWPAALAVLAVLLGTSRYIVLEQHMPDIHMLKYGSNVLMNSSSIHSFYFWDMVTSVRTLLTDKSMQTVEPMLPRCVLASSEQLDRRYGRSMPNLNVIFIQFESLGWDVIDRRVNGQELTPNFNRLRGRSIYCDFFVSQSLSGSTSDAEFAALTSYYPTQRAISAIRYAGRVPFTLPRFLKENGYSTAFFHANDGFFYNRQNIMRTLGFDRLVFADYYRSGKRKYCGTHDLPFFLETAEILRTIPQPFMAYLITLSCHSPYRYPKNEKPMLDLSGIPDLPHLKNFLQMTRYVDEALGRFLNELDQASLLNNTLLVFFGDHAPPHIPSSACIDTALPPPVQSILKARVPMFLSWPGIKKPSVIHKPVSHVDLSPTILAILGQKTETVLLGNNLLWGDNPGFVLRNSNPAVLAHKDRFFWGYLCESFTESYPLGPKEDMEQANQFANILLYSDYVLKGMQN